MDKSGSYPSQISLLQLTDPEGIECLVGRETEPAASSPQQAPALTALSRAISDIPSSNQVVHFPIHIEHILDTVLSEFYLGVK